MKGKKPCETESETTVRAVFLHLLCSLFLENSPLFNFISY
jgi:hypothetical protein